jgi:hypothetical protein
MAYMPKVIECLSWLAKIAEDREFHTPITEFLTEAEEYVEDERKREERRGERK